MKKLSPLKLLLLLLLWLKAIADLFPLFKGQEATLSNFAFLVLAFLVTYLVKNYADRLNASDVLEEEPVDYKKFRTWGPVSLYIINAIPFTMLWTQEDLGLAGIPVMIWGLAMLAALPFAIAPLVSRNRQQSIYLGNMTYLILFFPTLVIIFFCYLALSEWIG